MEMKRNQQEQIQPFYKSIIDQDECPVVICDTNHEVIYMNPSAISNYSRRGGEKIIGRSVLDCHNEKSRETIKKIVEWFAESADHNKVHTFFNKTQNKDVYMIALRDDERKLIGYYEKHEPRTRESSLQEGTE